MSQSQSQMDEIVVDIGLGASKFRFFSELADYAFMLAEEQDGLDLSDIPLGVKNRVANIRYHVGNGTPTRALLFQSAPMVHFQQVSIDFQSKIAECYGYPDFPIGPQQIELVQNEIEPYLQDICERNRKKEKELFLQQNPDWKDFFERLESNGILPSDPHSTCDSYKYKRCPLCAMQTVSCISCRSVMCPGRACAASQLIPFQSCSRHVSTATCLPCLQKDRDRSESSLGQCPDCKLWFCQLELTWCLGRPINESDRQASSYDRPIPHNDRAHSFMAIRCSSCAGPDDQPRCCNSKCWSRRGRCTGICWTCAMGDGLWCMCGRCWLCDDCKTSCSHIFKECPRCRKAFCVYECEYIKFCSECDRTTLCDDCVEEDWSAFAGPDVPNGVTVKACETVHCMGKICMDCWEGARCVGCKEVLCRSCTEWQLCDNGRLCLSCIPPRKQKY